MKCIFIEGLPGSGKTTNAKILANAYKNKGYKVSVYNEGDLHPIDLAWCSIMDEPTFQHYLNKYSDKKQDILSYSKKRGDQIITAYTKVHFENKTSFYDDFSKYEIFRTNDYTFFKETYQKLWSSFIPSEDIYIFECIFLQNHINELILKYDLTTSEMIDYFKDLLASLNCDFTVHYIKQDNIKSTIGHIIEERRSQSPHHKDWIDLVIEYFTTTKYGKEKDYLGLDGAFRYFSDRQNLELEILSKLDIDYHIHTLSNDYTEIGKSIKKQEGLQ